VDREPLGAVTVAGSRETGGADEDTRVRPKQARPLERPRFTEVRLGPAETSAGAAEAVRRTDVPDRIVRERPLWPLLTGAAVVLVVGLALAVYFVTAGQNDLAKEVGTQITDARIAVADARARLESLPMDSPLRNKLLTLQQWDRELQNLELGQDRSREVAARAREIASLARSVGEEARVAGATIPATPPAVLPAAPATTAVAPTEAPVDPMAPKNEAPAEVTPKPAEPPAVAPTTGPAPAENKSAAPEGPSPAPAPGKEPETKAPPAKVAPPPPPPNPEEKKPGR
jgi:hypothetical protein